ncbi:MAG: hypothetical protein JRI97_06685 [Deltaproteobacteria bacterium]|nr:hypothetical protein [Deltaproteobacteria bacterium]
MPGVLKDLLERLEGGGWRGKDARMACAKTAIDRRAARKRLLPGLSPVKPGRAFLFIADHPGPRTFPSRPRARRSFSGTGGLGSAETGLLGRNSMEGLLEPRSYPATLLFREHGKGPGGSGSGGAKTFKDPEQSLKEKGDRILCGSCGGVVTSRSQRVERHGSHKHTFFNPAGLVFTIGCFRQSAGVSAVGPATAEFTWFPGYDWQVGLCRKCFAHLGWRFSASSGDAFFGLILDRITESRQ